MTTVLITGANRGIGLELARCYAERGDTVLACCRRPADAEELASISGSVERFALDVGDGGSVAALAAALDDRPVDLLINNAGTRGPDRQSVLDMDFDGWLETFAVNTLGPVRVMQALIGNLRASDQPRVANITSQLGALALDMPMGYAYCTSKAALNKYMRMAAIELGREGIHVCVIHPGWVRTDMGGPQAEIGPEESAACIVRTIDGLNAETTGSFWKWNGEAHDW
ncbi:MAG: SDR family oxidoreductase [Pseudomonadales bacterium]|jgi:NAD(P)-dependent dehydrogenase (short-subunit alcohol dehydrogenase family)